MKVFMGFLNLLFPLRDSQRIVASIKPQELMRKIRVGRNIESGIVHLLPYQDQKVRACIREAKFNRNEAAIGHLAEVLHRYIQRMPAPHVIIPVPLSSKRRRRRGYNQVEELLTRAKTPFQKLLSRTRDTPPQTLIPPAQRPTNVEGAFSCNSPLSRIPIYVVIDDVTTTGATLKAAETALKQAGAEKILLVSLAH